MYYVADVSYDMLHIIYSIKRNSAKIKRNEPGLHETDFYSNTLFVIYSFQRTYMCITLFLCCYLNFKLLWSKNWWSIPTVRLPYIILIDTDIFNVILQAVVEIKAHDSINDSAFSHLLARCPLAFL